MLQPKVYTPEQVAEILQLSKNTVYRLINRGEIIAKKIGKVYRIPQSSISFIFTGMDEDILRAQKEDEKNLEKIEQFWLAKGKLPKLQFFNVTEHELSLMRALNIDATCGNPEMAIEVGSKPGFRRLCESFQKPRHHFRRS